MNLSEFFIKNNILLIALTLIFGIGGMFAFFNLNRNEDPGFKIRTASIITDTSGFSAKNTNDYVTRPIENLLLQTEEIEDIRSESLTGKSVIYADLYEYYDNIQPIWDKLRRKVALAKSFIPNGLEPVVNDEFADVYGALIGVSKQGADYEELFDLAENARDEYLKLPSRGKAEIVGKQDEVLYFYLNGSYFSNLGLTAGGIKDYISSVNVIKGGGAYVTPSNYIEITPKKIFFDEESAKNTVLNIKGKPVLAKNVFNIEKTVKKPLMKLVRSNGKEALIIGISMKEKGNILKWGKEIREKTAELSKNFPEAKFEILALQSDYVKLLINKFTSSLFESIFAVIFIVFIILGAKTGLITGGIILITTASAFLTMKALNIGLDKISLSALIISLGILVDNSIVIAQGSLKEKYTTDSEIRNHIITTAGKFQLPLFITTMTASLSFLPVFIARSTVGEYASNLFKVVFITLIFSWFYSVSLLPYLMYKFGYSDKTKQREIFLINFFKNKIPSALAHPKKTIILSVFLFLTSLILFYFVPKIFFPDSDRNMFEIRLNLKNGVSFEETNKAAIKTEDYLSKLSYVTSYSSYIGTSAPRYVLSASPEADRRNFAMILVNVKDYKEVGRHIEEAKSFINKELTNVQAVVRKIPLGPPVDAPFEVRIINNDIGKLFEYEKIVSRELSKIKGVYLVKNNWGDNTPEYQITINQTAAALAGVTPSFLFKYLNACYNGEELTYYYRGDIKVPVVLYGGGGAPLESISFYSDNLNKIIPLAQIAQAKPVFTYSRILRRNNSYVLTVQGWFDESLTANKTAEILTPVLDKIEGLNYEYGGTIEKSKKGNKSVEEKIPVGFGVIFLILIGYFNSLKKPFLILICAFLALTGANFGLFITNSDYGFITFLGYICLIGICANNGIILINEIKGNNPKEIERAAISRIEPVLLTCLTTIGGMLPLWIKNDPMFSTLAISIIFGLVSSILITLLVLPCVYLIFFADDAT